MVDNLYSVQYKDLFNLSQSSIVESDDATIDSLSGTTLEYSYGTITELYGATLGYDYADLDYIRGTTQIYLSGNITNLTAGGITATTLRVTGVSVLGGVTTSGITTDGITASSLNVSGLSHLGGVTTTSLVTTGITARGITNSSTLYVSGISNLLGGLTTSGITTAGVTSGLLNVSGLSHLGGVTTTSLVTTGITARGITNSSTLNVTGLSHLLGGPTTSSLITGGLTTTGCTVIGALTQNAGSVDVGSDFSDNSISFGANTATGRSIIFGDGGGSTTVVEMRSGLSGKLSMSGGPVFVENEFPLIPTMNFKYSNSGTTYTAGMYINSPDPNTFVIHNNGSSSAGDGVISLRTEGVERLKLNSTGLSGATLYANLTSGTTANFTNLVGTNLLIGGITASGTLNVAGLAHMQGGITTTGVTSSTLNLRASTNQIVLGNATKTTLTATAPSAARTYTIPDYGADATFSYITSDPNTGYNGGAGAQYYTLKSTSGSAGFLLDSVFNGEYIFRISGADKWAHQCVATDSRYRFYDFISSLEKFTILSGNTYAIGIGTALPTAPLHVNGGVSCTSLRTSGLTCTALNSTSMLTTGGLTCGALYNNVGVSASQVSSYTETVSLGADAGVLHTVTVTIAGASFAGFTCTNSKVHARSKVLATIQYYFGGTYITNGIPMVNIDQINNGSFMVYMINAHPTNALNGKLGIAFMLS